MTDYRKVVEKVELFDEAVTYSAGTPANNGWTINDTSAAGAPTYAHVNDSGPAFHAQLAADSEAEIVDLSQNDVLNIELDDLQ